MFGSLRKKKRSASNASSSSAASLREQSPSQSDKVKEQGPKRASLFSLPFSPSPSPLPSPSPSSVKGRKAQHSSPHPLPFARSTATSMVDAHGSETFPSSLSFQEASTTPTGSSSSPLSASTSLANAQQRDQQFRHPSLIMQPSSSKPGGSRASPRTRVSSLPSLMKTSAIQASSSTISAAAAVAEPSSRNAAAVQTEMDGGSSPSSKSATTPDENDARTLLSHLNATGASGQDSPYRKRSPRGANADSLSNGSTKSVSGGSHSDTLPSPTTRLSFPPGHKISSIEEQPSDRARASPDRVAAESDKIDADMTEDDNVDASKAEGAKRSEGQATILQPSGTEIEASKEADKASDALPATDGAAKKSDWSDIASSMAKIDALSVPTFDYEVRRSRRRGQENDETKLDVPLSSIKEYSSVQARLTVGLAFERVAHLSFPDLGGGDCKNRARTARKEPPKMTGKETAQGQDIDGTWSFVYAIVERHSLRPRPSSAAATSGEKPAKGSVALIAVEIVRLAVPEIFGARRAAYWAIERGASLGTPLINLFGS